MTQIRCQANDSLPFGLFRFSKKKKQIIVILLLSSTQTSTGFIHKRFFEHFYSFWMGPEIAVFLQFLVPDPLIAKKSISGFRKILYHFISIFFLDTIGTSSWRCSRSPFRPSTGNDVSGQYFHHYFLFFFPFFFFSVVTFSHRRRAQIKKLI